MTGAFIVAVFGGLLLAGGISLYQTASDVIARGESFLGLGWLFSDITYSEAQVYLNGGIAMMVIGGIIILFGLVTAIRKR